MENNNKISLIAKAVNISETDVSDCLDFLKPRDESIGVKLALPRLCSITPWLELFRYSELLDPKLHIVLKAISDEQSKWLKLLPKENIHGLKSRNLFPTEISTYPLYSVFTEAKSDDFQEACVAPFLTLFVIAYKNKTIDGEAVVKCGRSIRKLFYARGNEGAKLRKLFDGKTPSIHNLNQIIEVAGEFKSLSWIKEFRNKKAPERTKRCRSTAFHISPLNTGGKISTSNHPTASRLQTIRKRQVIRRPVLSKSMGVSKGLPPMESGVIEELLIAPPKAEYDIELEQRRLALYTEVEHQYLLWQWSHLNLNEIQLIKEEIQALIHKEDVVGFLLALCISTSRDINKVLSLPISDKARPRNSVWISIRHGLWGHPTYKPPHSFNPKTVMEPVLEDVQNHVVLYFPDIIKNSCAYFIVNEQDNITLEQALNLAPEEAQNRLKIWISEFKTRLGCNRITLARIRDWSLNAVLGRTMDPALTAHLFWCDSGNTVSVYYATYPSESLQRNYSRVLEDVIGDTPESPHSTYLIGSKLAVKSAAISTWINRWKENISDAKKLKGLSRLIAVHNEMVGYTVMMLMYVTGHRHVSDPFEDISYFDSQTGTFIIADKMDGGKDNGRVVWLNDMAVEQLQAYLLHLKGLASRIKGFEHQLGKRIELTTENVPHDLPLFFLLKMRGDNQPEPSKLTPTSLAELVQLTIPLNWPRHYLSSHLRRHDVPVEYIDYQLDHLKKGQRFDGPYSVLSIQDVAAVLKPALETLSKQVGWSVISGLQVFPVTASKQKYQQRSWVFGSQERANRRLKYKVRFKDRVRSLVTDFSYDSINKENLTRLLDNIKIEFSTESEQMHAQRLIYKLLKRHNLEAEQIVKKYWSFSVIPVKDSSVFSLNHGVMVKDGRHCKKVISTWAAELADGQYDHEQWVALLLSSAIVEGGLIEDRFISQFLVKNESHCFSFEKVMWLEFLDNSYEPAVARRWLPDTLTSLILLKKHRLFPGNPKTNYAKVKKVITRKLKLKSFPYILNCAKTLYQYQLPSYLSHYATGKNKSASLPMSAWLRLISGKRFAVKEQELNRSLTIINKAKKNSTNKVTSIHFKAGELLRSQFRDLLKEADNGLMSRSSLIFQLTRLINDNESELPPFLFSWLEWVILILKDGRYKKELVINTVRSYFLNVGRHLSLTTWTYTNFDELDEEDFVDIYIRTLELTTFSNRASNAALLESFHFFMHTQYSVPVIDFNDVEPNRKKVSVRANLLLPQEYHYLRSSQSRVNRCILTLSYRNRMRGKEIGRLSISNINLSEHPTVTIKNKIKTPASIRQISMYGNILEEELADFSELSQLCVSNKIKAISEVLPYNYNSDIQSKIRAVTGDVSSVNYDMRHSAVTISILKNTLPEADWPPKLREKDLDLVSVKKRRYDAFGSDTKTRRVLYQEALQTGHASPSTTLASYCHLLDWSLHRVLVREQQIDKSLLSPLTGINVTYLRKLEQRYFDHDFDHYIVSKLLDDSQVQAPEQASELIDHEPVSFNLTSQHPKTLYLIVEALRLAIDEKVPASVIAEKIEIEESVINHWLSRAKEVETYSGYQPKRTNNCQSWFVKEISSCLVGFDQAACDVETDNEAIQTLTTLFIQRYKAAHGTVFFDSESELALWVDGLCSFGIVRNKITLMVPSNHPLSADTATLNQFLTKHNLTQSHLMPHVVHARSGHAVAQAGLGIMLNGSSDFDHRISVQTELNLLLFAASCLVGTS